MPTFDAPDGIDTPLPSGNVRSSLDEKFTLISDAFVDIQNLLPTVSGASVGASNLTAIERLLVPDGMIGVDSFFPTFSTDRESLVVEHRQDGGISSCVLGGLYHETSTEHETLFSSIITGDGTFPVILAVKSLGYPSVEVKVLVEDTDNDVDLVLYRMDVTRAGSEWSVQNLRREATVLADRGSFSAVFDQDVPLVFGLQGAIGTGAGVRAAGVVAPWDLEVTGAYVRIGTAPTETDGLEVEIRHGVGTDAESVTSAPASWGAAEAGTVVTLGANTPRSQVSAGEFLYVYVTVAELAPVAADLYVTLLCRRIYHGIYR